MKLFFSRIFCLFLALQVLLSSAGFAMNEHYCKIKGEKVWSLSKVLGCCSVKEKSNFKQKHLLTKNLNAVMTRYSMPK
jgi:hypothetical protein